MYRPALAIRAVGLAAAIVLASGAAALAAKGGAGTETFTEHAHEQVLFSFPTANPCTGEEGTLTAIAANEVFHLTTHADGERWATGTAEGAVTFTPVGAEGLAYSGHFTSWFGEAINQKNHVEHDTNTFVLRAANGSQVVVHMKDHLSTNAAGEVTVEFKTESAHCG
ncbi:MAG TPA: hypothetical protein VGY30_05820 [Solirubrobacteraceae bacterium]|jgi:hypothetical protein|nr:hypothetical protein [Solirubrobacteraceae bacterium]